MLDYVVTFTASVTVINYIQDHWALIPALLGAFAGTWIGMKYRKSISDQERGI